MERVEEASVDEPLPQRILDMIYQDPDVRRGYKESLVHYLAAHRPELLDRLKINGRIKEALARAAESLDRN